MTRTIKTTQEGFLEESLDFVEKVFTESEDEKHKCNYVADTRTGFENIPEDTQWVA